jgi:hypothetical protein
MSFANPHGLLEYRFVQIKIVHSTIINYYLRYLISFTLT